MFYSYCSAALLAVLATVALFTAVFQWNQWFDVFLYNSSNIKLSTLQYELQKILQNSSASMSSKTAAMHSRMQTMLSQYGDTFLDPFHNDDCCFRTDHYGLSVSPEIFC